MTDTQRPDDRVEEEQFLAKIRGRIEHPFSPAYAFDVPYLLRLYDEQRARAERAEADVVRLRDAAGQLLETIDIQVGDVPGHRLLVAAQPLRAALTAAADEENPND